jgi:hypothetical protein
MSFKNSLFVSSLLVVCFGVCHSAFADVSFSEIMYDTEGSDTDKEWVEIYNSGSSTISISGWKFNDGANHTLNNPPTNGGQGTLEIAAGSHVVLAGNASAFLAEYSSYTGTVIDTVMSLANTSDTLSLIDQNGGTVTSYTYSSDQGAAGDGLSLQNINGTWGSGTPTPGATNTHSVSDDGEDTGNQDLSDDTEATSIEAFIEPAYTANIITTIVTSAGMPTDFDTFVTNELDKTVTAGYYVWNFGDGTSMSYEGERPFEHVYAFAGQYIVLLKYYAYVGAAVPDDTDRVTIKVTDPGIAISSIANGVLTIANNSQYEKDISDWKVVSGVSTYIFPDETFVIAHESLHLPTTVTGFSSTNNHATLYYPNGEVADIFPKQKTETVSSSKIYQPKLEADSLVPLEGAATNSTTVGSFMPLAASVIEGEKQASTTSKMPLFILATIAVISLGAGSILYVRKNPSEKITADGFEIFEE